MRVNSTIAFLLALVCALCGPLFLSPCRLFYFVPYLIVCFYQYSRFGVLWRTCLSGLLLDLLSSNPFFGITSLNYCIVSTLLYGQTRNFFADKVSTLPLMTFLFSALSTLCSLIILSLQRKTSFFHWSGLATDLICMPLADALYALLVFSLPFQIHYKILRLRLRRKR